MIKYKLLTSKTGVFMHGPNPNYPYPFEKLPYQLENPKRTVFLNQVITRKSIIIGDYTYYDDAYYTYNNEGKGQVSFEKDNVLYHYDFSKEKLIIGKFCALATGTKFIMASSSHKLDGFSTYPFSLFGHGWEKEMDPSVYPNKGDTVVGNDVWFGYDSTILPAVKIGNGAIIGAKAVVTKDVPAYAVVGGNPAKILKMRFSDDIINELQKIAWWNWPKEKITRNIRHIIGANLEELQKAK